MSNSEDISIQEVTFEELDFTDSFFDSFKKDYNPYYDVWLKKKAKDKICTVFDQGRLKALLKLKTEGPEEDYCDIVPTFPPKKRLKICAFKVECKGENLGKRFLDIVFRKAIEEAVDEIYVTIVNNSTEKRRLVDLLKEHGFHFHGMKDNREDVYVCNIKRRL